MSDNSKISSEKVKEAMHAYVALAQFQAREHEHKKMLENVKNTKEEFWKNYDEFVKGLSTKEIDQLLTTANQRLKQ